MPLYTISEAQMRDGCKRAIEGLELWLRRLIDTKLTEAYGQDYLDAQRSDGSRVINSSLAKTLEQRTQHPVFLTLSEAGVLVCAQGETQHIPAGPTTPPLDPVGAGDTFIAALGAALASGATPQEAGTLATLAAAVTVEKLNQTGTASPEEIFGKYDLVT